MSFLFPFPALSISSTRLADAVFSLRRESSSKPDRLKRHAFAFGHGGSETGFAGKGNCSSATPTGLFPWSPLLLINRAVEDLIRNRSPVYELPGKIPFHELGAATKYPNHGPSRKIGRSAGSIGVGEIKPARDAGMTNGHAVTGVARQWDVCRIVEI